MTEILKSIGRALSSCLAIIVSLVVLGTVGLAYISLDSWLFADCRPWALWLAVVQLVTLVISLVCFVLVLTQMCRSETPYLAIVCGILTPFFGIGLLIAFVWGWREASQQNRNATEGTIHLWSGAVIAQLMIVGYLWFSAPVVPRVPQVPKGAEAAPVPQRESSCHRCRGSGTESCHICFGGGRANCFTCGGRGYTSNGWSGESHRCGSCGASGKQNCSACGGRGCRSCSSCGGFGR